MKKEILEILAGIERKENIRILYAVESGSRAWGFASRDSDYDVRYIYVRPVEDYLRVDSMRDTIEGPLDEVMDFSGWDLKKMLELLHRSNPSLMEWTVSPIVYRTSPEWETIAVRIPELFDPRTTMQHYCSKAKQDWKKFRETETVKVKKYLYMLQCVLSCHWLEGKGTVPPVLFAELCREMLPEELEKTVQELTETKIHGGEIPEIPHIRALDDFLQEELTRMQTVVQTYPKAAPADYETLNKIFRSIVMAG